MRSPDLKSAAFPPGLENAFWFQLFNAVSFQIFNGTPVILYAKSLGASATMLGVLGSLSALFTVLQIPAAQHLPRFGYRRFVLAGWGARNVCVFAVTLIPLLSFLGNDWKLSALLALQLVFNFLRGLASGAWFPWITELLPEESRARYLSVEQRCVQGGSLVALFFCGCMLKTASTPAEFSLVFLVSAVGGALSLYFLNRMPEVHAQETLKLSGSRVPWGEMIAFPPFLRFIGFNLLFLFATASLPVFSVAFLKGRAGFGENEILLLVAAAFMAGLLSLAASGRALVKMGPQRLMQWLLVLHAVFIAGWIGLASRVVEPSLAVVLPIFIASGIASPAFAIANSHLMMSTLPQMGRSHFAAVFSGITSLCAGVTPILWGMCLDFLHRFQYPAAPRGAFEWNPYSIYFLVLLGFLGVTFLASLPLREKLAFSD